VEGVTQAPVTVRDIIDAHFFPMGRIAAPAPVEKYRFLTGKLVVPVYRYYSNKIVNNGSFSH
jgi:hypothetical protein